MLAPRSKIVTTVNKPIVSVVLRSGIGNRFFQILAGLGYAERTGRCFVYYEKQIKENFHSGPKTTMELLMAIFPQIKFYRGIVNGFSNYTENSERFYDGDIVPDLAGNVMLHGYFQNEIHFPDGAREKFRIPKPPNSSFSTDGIDFTHTYFIHFRLGDYVDSKFDVDLTDYYREAITRITALDSDCRFLVFSDQPARIDLNRYGLDKFAHTVVPTGVWETLYLMSLCNGAICANSTYSWFGAFALRGSPVVFMPSRWIKGLDSTPNPKWATVIAVP